MKVTTAIVQGEFIGLEVEVVRSTHQGYVGIKGKVLDETKNTFLILHDGRRKRIPKAHSTFRVHLPDGTIVDIDGVLLIGRPEDRLKKRIRRRW